MSGVGGYSSFPATGGYAQPKVNTNIQHTKAPRLPVKPNIMLLGKKGTAKYFTASDGMENFSPPQRLWKSAVAR